MPHIKINEGFLTQEGLLKLVEWAKDGGVVQDEDSDAAYQKLLVRFGELPSPMAHTTATGKALVTNGMLGVDLIRLAAGEAFDPHTHPGDHLLIIVAGEGSITYDGRIYATRAGQVYLIEGSIPHAVGAFTEHLILAVGCPHKGVGDPERAKLVEYAEVLSPIGHIHCLVHDREGPPSRMCDVCPARGWPGVAQEPTG